MNELLWLFATPFLSAIVLLLTPKAVKKMAVALSLAPFAILVMCRQTLAVSVVNFSWIPALDVHMHLVFDPLSSIFVWLTAIIVPISFLAVKDEMLKSQKLFFFLGFILQGLLIGFFTARDLALFTFLFEGMLIPAYCMIVLFGNGNKEAAALKFLIYMIAGSVLLIAAIISLYFAAAHAAGEGTFSIDALSSLASNTPFSPLLAAIFFLAFAVKTPLFPFHAWLPDAYCRASTAATILLSALLSKAGIYGFLRIGGDLFAPYMHLWGHYFVALAIAGVFYGALAAWGQIDYKRLIAYSSFSHVNFILVGVFGLTAVSHTGAILQSFNHGITIAALFLVAGWLEQRVHSTSLDQALAKYMPKLCWMTLFFVLSSVALPGMNNFIGELLILFGLFTQSPYSAALLGITVILSVVYMLRFMKHAYFGPALAPQRRIADITYRELMIAFPLALIILYVGLYPMPVIDAITPQMATQILGDLPQ